MSGEDFRIELEKLINRESRENGSDTPDFILANYLVGCLVAFAGIPPPKAAWV